MVSGNYTIIRQVQQYLGGNARIKEICYQLFTAVHTCIATEILTLAAKKIRKSIWRKIKLWRQRKKRLVY